MKTDILIVGSGVAGLYCALNLPKEKRITVVTKNKARRSDSYLAQGGICVLRDEDDYDSFYEDTLKAGHYETNPDSVHIIIHSSQEVIADLVSFGVRFEKNGEEFTYTREGAHSQPRILFHEDETGKEITSHLLETAKGRENITIIENYTMVDLICEAGECQGIIGHDENGEYSEYGLVAEKRVNALGEEYDYEPAWYKLTDIDGEEYTVIIGDAYIFHQNHHTGLFHRRHKFLIKLFVQPEGLLLGRVPLHTGVDYGHRNAQLTADLNGANGLGGLFHRVLLGI